MLTQKKQIFMIPFAGGSSFSFNSLMPFIESEVEVIVLELPGRGKRLREKLDNNFYAALEDYKSQFVQKRNNAPYLIYGHSMGAPLTLALAAWMEKKGTPPEKIIVTGSAGPHLRSRKLKHLLTKDEFHEELILMGGIPKEILDNDEFYAFYSPVIRNDFHIAEMKNTFYDNLCVDIPIHVLMGDKEEDSEFINDWKRYTKNEVFSQILVGDHFFVFNHKKLITDLLKFSDV